MTKLPNWLEIKNMKTVVNKSDHYVNMEIEIQYIPLKFFINQLIKSIGWRFWLYPLIVKNCLDAIIFTYIIFLVGMK